MLYLETRLLYLDDNGFILRNANCSDRSMRYWWRMTQEVKIYVKTCGVCVSFEGLNT